MEWISERTSLLLSVLEHAFERKSINRQYLLLQGDEDPSSPKISTTRGTLKFRLKLSNLKLRLGLNLTSAEECGHASVSNFDQELESPVIVSGENGAGKSLLSRALCGVDITSGAAAVHVGAQHGYTRMVFQDPLRQCLSRDFSRFRSLYGSEWKSIFDIYSQLVASAQKYAAQMSDVDQDFGVFNPLKENASLFQLRALLAAIRISQSERSAGLILDEPTWGLSKTSSIALVLAVGDQCHTRGRPLFVISHRPWWKELGRNRLVISKEMNPDPIGNNLERFRINVDLEDI